MISFAEAMAFTRTISSVAAFGDAECQRYFEVLMGLHPGDLVVEIGLEYGRSSAIALQVCIANRLKYCGIDMRPKEEWFARLAALINELVPNFSAHFGVDSAEIRMRRRISAILIDGCHTYASVMADCENFLPSVVIGGYAFFHDYGQDSLPEVWPAVQHYMRKHRGWVEQPSAGCLGVWRKEMLL